MAMGSLKWEQLPWIQQEGIGATPLWASLLWGPLLLLGSFRPLLLTLSTHRSTYLAIAGRDRDPFF